MTSGSRKVVGSTERLKIEKSGRRYIVKRRDGSRLFIVLTEEELYELGDLIDDVLVEIEGEPSDGG